MFQPHPNPSFFLPPTAYPLPPFLPPSPPSPTALSSLHVDGNFRFLKSGKVLHTILPAKLHLTSFELHISLRIGKTEVNCICVVNMKHGKYI